MEEQSPGPRRSSRGSKASSGPAARTPTEGTAGDRPADKSGDQSAKTVGGRRPPPVLFQPPSPSPSAEPAPVSDDAPTAERGTTARAKKTAVKKTTVRKAPAKKTAAKKAPTKKAPATNVEPEHLPAPAVTAPKPARAAPATRKKVAPRKTAVPKQPRPDPGPGLSPELGPAEPAHPAAAEPPAPVRLMPPVEAAPMHPSLTDSRQLAVRLLNDPAHAPELLAAVAVRLIGPRAAEWADAMRAAYPAATNEGLARLATRRFVRLAGAGGLLAAGAGLFAPAAELAIAALTRAALVLHLAAAHGHDPSDPDRAAEILILTQVHADESAARAAVKAAAEASERREAHERGAAYERGGADQADQSPAPSRAAEGALRLVVPLAAETGGWAILRMAARVVPGARAVAATAGQAAAAERLAIRASAYYRRHRPA